jgi:hypothetical protein
MSSLRSSSSRSRGSDSGSGARRRLWRAEEEATREAASRGMSRGGLKMQIQRIAGVSLRAPTPLAVGSKAANGEEWGGGRGGAGYVHYSNIYLVLLISMITILFLYILYSKLSAHDPEITDESVKGNHRQNLAIA